MSLTARQDTNLISCASNQVRCSDRTRRSLHRDWRSGRGDEADILPSLPWKESNKCRLLFEPIRSTT